MYRVIYKVHTRLNRSTESLLTGFVKGGYYDHFWIHRSKWSFWYQMKASIFSHYACEFLRATDVACKSYKRKRSESSVTTIITTYEFSLCFRL